jgi:type I restriction enzyme, S subunit
LNMRAMDFISKERFDLLGAGKVRPRDILFCLRGSLGKFASVGNLLQGAIASSLVIVRPKDTILDRFVLAYFRSSICGEMINRFKNGAAQPNLSAGSLKKFIIPCPSLEEQSSVVSELEDLHVETRRLERLYLKKLAKLDALRTTLLHQAFSGAL